MLKPEDPKAQLALVTGQRAATEQLLGALKQHLANWKAEEAKRGKVARAFLWSYSEVWTSRIEGVIASLDQHLGNVRALETTLGAEATSNGARRRRKRR